MRTAPKCLAAILVAHGSLFSGVESLVELVGIEPTPVIRGPLTRGIAAILVPQGFTAASRTPPWLPSERGCLGRRLSRA